MASITSYRKTYQRWLKQYEKQAYKELRKAFKKWGDSIPFSMMTEQNYEQMVDVVVLESPMVIAYEKLYTDIGLVHGKRTGRQINKELKFFKPGDFESEFIKNIRNFLLTTNMGERITSVEGTYISTIQKLLANRLEDGKTIAEASREIEKIVKKPNFYRWQAERIARTETTTAANFAAVEANEVTDFVMEKVWISGSDSRVRRTPPNEYDHQDLNGKTVDPKEAFTTSRGEMLMFPGDTNGSAGNIINCRCSVAFRPVRDANGDLIEKTK